MNWGLLILAATVFYLLYQVDKRVKRIEEERGLGYSYSFTVNARDAIIFHPKFLKDSKVKSATKDIPTKEWPEKDWKAFRDFIDKHLGEKGWVNITYMAGENVFFIRDNQGRGSFIFRDWGTNDIFSETILEDKLSFGDSLEFGLMVKIEPDGEGERRDFLIGYLEERFKDFKKKTETKILFKYPYNSTGLDDDYYKKLGFEVKREGGDDIYEDRLGHAIPTFITYKQNRAEIMLMV